MLFQKSLSWILDKESKSHCGGSTSQIFTAYVPKGARSKFNTSRLIIFPHHKILTSDYQTYSIMIIIFLLEVPGNATRSCLSSLLKEVSVCNGNGTAHLKSPRAKKSQNSQIWMSCWVVVTYIYYVYILSVPVKHNHMPLQPVTAYRQMTTWTLVSMPPWPAQWNQQTNNQNSMQACIGFNFRHTLHCKLSPVFSSLRLERLFQQMVWLCWQLVVAYSMPCANQRFPVSEYKLHKMQ